MYLEGDVFGVVVAVVYYVGVLCFEGVEFPPDYFVRLAGFFKGGVRVVVGGGEVDGFYVEFPVSAVEDLVVGLFHAIIIFGIDWIKLCQ